MPASTRQLRDLTSGDDSEWSLAEAALLIARDEYPDLDVPAYLDRLERLATRVAECVASGSSPLERVMTLNRLLFEDQGFSGNVDDYYDPRNSFLNQVLDRRLGIPITLSIIYIEAARHLDLNLQGVAFPGRFLVKFAHEQGEVVLDPFSGGVSLGLDELANLLRGSYGIAPAQLPPLDQLLAATGKRDVLMRLLRNLKSIYLHNEHLPKALRVLDQMLAITPGLIDERRERGEVHQRLECFRPALADYQRYAELAGDTPESDEVRRRIIELQQRIASLH